MMFCFIFYFGLRFSTYVQMFYNLIQDIYRELVNESEVLQSLFRPGDWATYKEEFYKHPREEISLLGNLKDQ